MGALRVMMAEFTPDGFHFLKPREMMSSAESEGGDRMGVWEGKGGPLGVTWE